MRGYHECMDIWNSVLGEELPLRREPENVLDEQAVAITKDSQVVGHVAIEFPLFSFIFWQGHAIKELHK